MCFSKAVDDSTPFPLHENVTVYVSLAVETLH